MWWLLYVIATLLLAVVGLVEVFVEGSALRKVSEIVATIAGFELIWMWLGRNRIALDLDQGSRPA